MTIQPESQAILVNEDGPRKRRKIGVAEEWTASLYKTTSSPPYQLVSDPTNKSELEKFIKTLFPTDEITMEPESKRVGNSGGFNLIELLGRMTKVEKQLENSKEEYKRNVEEQQTKIEELQQKLRKETQKLKQETQKLKRETQKFEERLEEETQKFEDRLEENEYNLLMVHANELEWTVGLDDMKTRHKRNEVTHGGDIKLSIRTIGFLKKRGEIRRAGNASIGFKTTYGFSIHELGPVIATAPEEIVELFNLGGTLRKLDIWRKTFDIKSKPWIEGCDQIIDAWLRAGGGSDSCIRNRAKEEYMKISQHMAEYIDDIRRRETSRDTTA